MGQLPKKQKILLKSIAELDDGSSHSGTSLDLKSVKWEF